jgi:hypothetical protein
VPPALQSIHGRELVTEFAPGIAAVFDPVGFFADAHRNVAEHHLTTLGDGLEDPRLPSLDGLSRFE